MKKSSFIKRLIRLLLNLKVLILNLEVKPQNTKRYTGKLQGDDWGQMALESKPRIQIQKTKLMFIPSFPCVLHAL